MDISSFLDEIKASPYKDIVIKAPHSGIIRFCNVKRGDLAHGPQGQWKEKPGTQIAELERERNPKGIYAQEKGEISFLASELEGTFVQSGTHLATLRHMLTRQEVEAQILKKALHLFLAPERAKYYFTPEVDKKIRASDAHSVAVREGMDIMIMSRMKREAPVRYSGPEGVIYSIYFKYNENKDAGDPLLGICPRDELPEIQDVIMRVQTEWKERG